MSVLDPALAWDVRFIYLFISDPTYLPPAYTQLTYPDEAKKGRKKTPTQGARRDGKKERKKTDKPRELLHLFKPREGWEDGTPPPHRDFKERSVVL